MRFISGIEIVPVVRTFATAVPEIIPIKLEPTTAAFAGPPRDLPVNAFAISINTFPAPELSRTAPNKTIRITNVAVTPRGVPNIPLPPKYKCDTTLVKLYPLCPASPGKKLPKRA